MHAVHMRATAVSTAAVWQTAQRCCAHLVAAATAAAATARRGHRCGAEANILAALAGWQAHRPACDERQGQWLAPKSGPTTAAHAARRAACLDAFSCILRAKNVSFPAADAFSWSIVYPPPPPLLAGKSCAECVLRMERPGGERQERRERARCAGEVGAQTHPAAARRASRPSPRSSRRTRTSRALGRRLRAPLVARTLPSPPVKGGWTRHDRPGEHKQARASEEPARLAGAAQPLASAHRRRGPRLALCSRLDLVAVHGSAARVVLGTRVGFFRHAVLLRRRAGRRDHQRPRAARTRRLWRRTAMKLFSASLPPACIILSCCADHESMVTDLCRSRGQRPGGQAAHAQTARCHAAAAAERPRRAGRLAGGDRGAAAPLRLRRTARI